MPEVTAIERPRALTASVAELRTIARNRRLQNKAIAGILRGVKDGDRDERLKVYKAYSVSLRAGERDRYLREVYEGKITYQDYKDYLKGIPTPVNLKRKLGVDAKADRKELHEFKEGVGEDNQVKAIVSFALTGDIHTRAALTDTDYRQFLADARKKLPVNALDFNTDKYTLYKGILDRIQQKNGIEKRREYELAIDRLAKAVYGRQWEYVEQLLILKEEAQKAHERKVARTLPAPARTPEVKVAPVDRNRGIEQARQFNREHRIAGKIHDGYKDGGRGVRFDDEGKAIFPGREVLVVDRAKDSELQRAIALTQALKSRIESQYSSQLKGANEVRRAHVRGEMQMHLAYEIGRYVFNRMDTPNAQAEVDGNFGSGGPLQGKEVPIGNIDKRKGMPGVCRHRALLFQVLAAEVGIDSALVRGNIGKGRFNLGGHAWNEVVINGKKRLVDITYVHSENPFKKPNYEEFKRSGGFADITGGGSGSLEYMDIYNHVLYRTK